MKLDSSLRTLISVSLVCIIVVMATVRGNPNRTRNKPEPVDWRFRVRGENRDGETVTLGKYNEEREAKSRYDELVEEGYYRNLRVQHIKPKPADG